VPSVQKAGGLLDEKEAQSVAGEAYDEALYVW